MKDGREKNKLCTKKKWGMILFQSKHNDEEMETGLV